MIHIYLVGMPGSGKSFWMKKIARQFNCKAIDLDKKIEQTTHQSIPEIFEGGETLFRTIEHDVLMQLMESSKDQNIVIATGGGAPCFHDNMERMLNDGLVIYLEAPPKFLLSRVNQSATKRPLLNAPTQEAALEKIENLYTHRRQYYERAHERVMVINATITNFATIIQSKIDSQWFTKQP